MPVKTTLYWDQDRVTARVRAAAEKRLRAVGAETVAHIKAS